MVTYSEISMTLGLINEYKVCFGAVKHHVSHSCVLFRAAKATQPDKMQRIVSFWFQTKLLCVSVDVSDVISVFQMIR